MRDSVEMEYDKLQTQYRLRCTQICHCYQTHPGQYHFMPLLFEKRSEKLVKGLACEVVIVRMELDFEIFKEIIYHKISNLRKLSCLWCSFHLGFNLQNMRKSNYNEKSNKTNTNKSVE